MTGLLNVFVPGASKTKGSLTIVSRWYATDTQESKDWRWLVAEAARRELRGKSAYDGPVSVQLVFFLPRNGSASAWPIGHQTGDADKLERNILDALQDAGLYSNDSKVVALYGVKVYADAENPSGVHIVAGPITPGVPRGLYDLAREARQRQGLLRETGY